MRIENGDGSAQIIDLDGRRIVSVDSARKIYGVITFDEMRAQIQEMQQRLQAAQREKNAQPSVSPKVQVTPTPNTRSILGEMTREGQVQVDMDMQAQNSDASSGNAKGTMTFRKRTLGAPSATFVICLPWPLTLLASVMSLAGQAQPTTPLYLRVLVRFFWLLVLVYPLVFFAVVFFAERVVARKSYVAAAIVATLPIALALFVVVWLVT